jgi:CubicO group peptidase (beta-lactamase class C family)
MNHSKEGKSMIRRSYICLPLMLATQLAAGEEEGVKPGPFKAVTQLVQEQVESGLVGAAALLVAHNGKIEVEQGFGTLSRKAGAKPCRSDSVFLVASISKPVTAMAVMKLVDQGRIALDDPVQKYLPEFTGDGRERITFATCSATLPGLPDMLPDNIELRKRHAPLKDFVSGALRTPLLFPPEHVCPIRAWAFCWLPKSWSASRPCLWTVSCNAKSSAP